MDRAVEAAWATDDAPPRCKAGEDKLIAQLTKGLRADENVSESEWSALFRQAFPRFQA